MGVGVEGTGVAVGGGAGSGTCVGVGVGAEPQALRIRAHRDIVRMSVVRMLVCPVLFTLFLLWES
jgi:hypothetical protein